MFKPEGGAPISASGSQAFTPNTSVVSGGQYSLSTGTVSGEGSYSVSAGDFGNYSGSGTVSFGLQNIFNANVTSYSSGTSSYSNNLSGTALGTVKVTYTYTPIAPVPEPSSWLLSLGGLAGLSGLGIMRKRKVA